VHALSTIYPPALRFDPVFSSFSPEPKGFVANITSSLKKLDKELHIGTWGEIKEWKLSDSYGYDVQNDTHRHLSHLVGWFPGYSISSSISSAVSGYSNSTIQNAIRTSLVDRGQGTDQTPTPAGRKSGAQLVGQGLMRLKRHILS
jgi:hypothetical protein